VDYLDRVMQVIDSYRHLGERALPNGTRLVGHVPHVAPEAWLHSVFAPLRTDDVREVEWLLGRPIPAVFATFLSRSNGIRLFSDSLSIDGLRRSFIRVGDEARQPYSIMTTNRDERPRYSKHSYLYIGGYSYDGSLLYIDETDMRVYRCRKKSAKPLNSWASFEEMLESEANRLSDLFDRNGRLLNPNQPTTP
jgi:hypothetical protein